MYGSYCKGGGTDSLAPHLGPPRPAYTNLVQPAVDQEKLCVLPVCCACLMCSRGWDTGKGRWGGAVGSVLIFMHSVACHLALSTASGQGSGPSVTVQRQSLR